jgi:hypothetical protein
MKAMQMIAGSDGSASLRYSEKAEGHMAEVTYRSNVRIERVKGPLRQAYLPAETAPVIFGVHGAGRSTTECPRMCSSPTPPRLITSWRPLPADSPAPSEARWKRVKSMLRMRGWFPKRWAKSKRKITSS